MSAELFDIRSLRFCEHANDADVCYGSSSAGQTFFFRNDFSPFSNHRGIKTLDDFRPKLAALQRFCRSEMGVDSLESRNSGQKIWPKFGLKTDEGIF